MNNNKLILPGAIVIAAALIGGAILYRGPQTGSNPAVNNTATSQPKTANIKPVTAKDHILGNPDAKVVMIEYTDLECPFCKAYEATMEKVMDTYGKDGTVAWVYRHFPIASLHSKAPKESEATECVAELGGESKFWDYTKQIYAITPANNGLDPAQLPILAEQVGVNKKAFQSCLDSGKYTAAITQAYNDAIAAGGQGTPYTVIVTKTPLSAATVKNVKDIFSAASAQYPQLPPDALGYVTTDNKVVFNGNLPFSLVQQIIAALIS